MKNIFLTKNLNNVFKMHLIVWTIYWCIELFKFYLVSTHHINIWIESTLNLSFGTAFFYTLILFVLPRRAIPLDRLQLLVRLVVAVLVFVVFRRCAVLLLAEWINFKSPVVTNINFFGVSSFEVFFRYGVYAALVWFFRRQGELNKQILERELKEEELKNELLETKYAVLKAQINPHFLFNTLNFLHSKAIFHNDEVLDKAILQLSDILRYALKDNASGHLVAVNQEIEHLKKMYELHRLRFDGKFYLEITEEGAQWDRKIPVLILLTFFENAIKHGVFDDPDNPALLRISQSPQMLEVFLRNKIRQTESVSIQDKFAIGKRYVKNTLEHLCKNCYQLDYHNDDSFHTVHLKIYEDQLYYNR